jgi:hypothetical protein
VLFREGRYMPRYALGPAGPGFPFDQFASLVGDERSALARAAPPELGVELSASARATDALQRITEAAASRRVVMLNEAHTASRHRMFLAQLLRALRPMGFTHLAGETFPNSGPGGSWTDLGRKLDPATGAYTRDPVLAEAVREAAELGYQFVAYEQRTEQRVPGEDRKAAVARREQAQADNFAALLAARPDARTLVFVGYGHLRETVAPTGSEWFARRLAQRTGLDPLTIEQALTGSFAPAAKDGPLARQVLARFSPRSPIVVEAEGLVVGADRGEADLAVFHPALPDVDGRPGWLAADLKRRRVRVPLPLIRGLTLAQAMRAGDPDVGVPADQYPLAYGAKEAVFFLRPGDYQLRLETLDGFKRLQTFSA